MISTRNRLLVVLTCLTLATSAYAQSPREQLLQMVEQLQKAQNDNALRERIIKLGAEIKPAPAVPEEARRPFVEGVTILKSAKDAGSQKLAIGSFNEALKIAPWWGDAYYNLAVAQELTGQLDDAERTLKWFMLSNPGESDAREAQDRVYAIGAKRKMAAAESAAKRQKAEEEENSPRARAEAFVAAMRTQYAGSVTQWLYCGVNLNQYWKCTENEARGSNWVERLFLEKANPVTFEVVEANVGKVRFTLGSLVTACGIANSKDPNSVSWSFCDGPGKGESAGTYRFIPRSSGNKALIEYVGVCSGVEMSCSRQQFIFN